MSVSRRCRLFAATVLLLAVVAPGPASADRPVYTMDTDPLRLGKKALAGGRLAEAKALFEEAVHNGHHVPRALFGLGEIAMREGRYDDAEPLYRRALESGGDDYAEAHAGLGLTLLRLDRDQEAAQEFARALDADGKLWEPHYGRARLLLAQQKWSDALRELEHGAGLHGVAEGEDEYRFGMALYQLGRGEVTEAETSALLALHLNPTEPEYGTLVGEIYERRNAPTLAIDAYEQALRAPGMVQIGRAHV